MASSREEPGSVEIDSSSLQWVGAGMACFLSFTPTGEFDSTTLLPKVRSTIASANPAVGGGLPLSVSWVVEGTNALHLRLEYGTVPRRLVRAWLEGLARALSDAGLAGKLHRPLPQRSPHWAAPAMDHQAVAVMYATRSSPDRDFIRRLSAGHGVDVLPNHALSSDGGFSVYVPYTPDLLAAIGDLGSTKLVAWKEPAESASVYCSPLGAYGWTHLGTRADQVDRARSALIDLAPDLDHAFAEVRTGLSAGWSHAPHLPATGLQSSGYLQRRAIRPHRVFDAHGLQILTAHHLERATSLTDWRTTQIGDRYLVEARDLDAWYAEDDHDAEVLARARDDFGDMIITQAELRALKRAASEAAAAVPDNDARNASP